MTDTQAKVLADFHSRILADASNLCALTSRWDLYDQFVSFLDRAMTPCHPDCIHTEWCISEYERKQKL